MRADRNLSVVPVAISLMTSCISGLTLLGSSTELYYQGPTYAFVVIGMLLSGPITAWTVLPVFYRMNELSLYKVSCLNNIYILLIISLIVVVQLSVDLYTSR